MEFKAGDRVEWTDTDTGRPATNPCHGTVVGPNYSYIMVNWDGLGNYDYPASHLRLIKSCSDLPQHLFDFD